MNLVLTPEQEERLTLLAASIHKAPEEVAHDIIVQALDEDARFRDGVQRGLDQAARGEFVDEEEMEDRLHQLLGS